MSWLFSDCSGRFVFASPALAQPQPQVVISAPSAGASVPGPDVTVTIQVTGTTLVPAANATKLEDLHVHYLLDVDPAPWLDGKTPLPMGNPNIVHSGALSNTFTAVAPGAHRVVVVLGLSSHAAVQPPVAPAVSFTVAGAGAARCRPRYRARATRAIRQRSCSPLEALASRSASPCGCWPAAVYVLVIDASAENAGRGVKSDRSTPKPHFSSVWGTTIWKLRFQTIMPLM